MRTDGNPEKLQTRLERAAMAFNLSPEGRDLTIKQVFGSQQSPDDPTVILAVTANYAREVALPLVEAVEALPSKLDHASQKAVDSVAGAATAKVEAAHAKLADNLSEVVKIEVANHLKQVEMRREMGLGACIAIACILTSIAGGCVGWSIGRSDVSGLATEWASLAARSDSRRWLQLINANGNIADTLMGNCYAGSPNVWSREGASACKVPMWLDKIRAPTAAGSMRSTYQSVTDWLASWDLLVLVMTSVLIGLLGAKAIRSLRSLRPIRWIVD